MTREVVEPTTDERKQLVSPITVAEDGTIENGHHRAAALAELGTRRYVVTAEHDGEPLGVGIYVQARDDIDAEVRARQLLASATLKVRRV